MDRQNSYDPNENMQIIQTQPYTNETNNNQPWVSVGFAFFNKVNFFEIL